MKDNTNNQTQFMIYRDGQPDRMFLAKQRAKHFLGATTKISYKALEATLNVLDELVASAQ